MLYSNICYVDADATGNNDGSSWSDAFNYLQDALAQATSGWEIHVAEGTYKPDAKSSNPSGTGDRTATFQLVNGVILKGGYAGAGTPDPNARDVDTYQTVLSGDIGIDSGNSDNCYHVVTSSGCDLYTVLDGFTTCTRCSMALPSPAATQVAQAATVMAAGCTANQAAPQ
jgi:hypothetical protein